MFIPRSGFFVPVVCPTWITLPSGLHATTSFLGFMFQSNVSFSGRFSLTQPPQPPSPAHSTSSSTLFPEHYPCVEPSHPPVYLDVYCLSSPTWLCASWEQEPWLSWLFLQSQGLEQCLPLSQCSVHICWSWRIVLENVPTSFAQPQSIRTSHQTPFRTNEQNIEQYLKARCFDEMVNPDETKEINFEQSKSEWA